MSFIFAGASAFLTGIIWQQPPAFPLTALRSWGSAPASTQALNLRSWTLLTNELSDHYCAWCNIICLRINIWPSPHRVFFLPSLSLSVHLAPSEGAGLNMHLFTFPWGTHREYRQRAAFSISMSGGKGPFRSGSHCRCYASLVHYNCISSAWWCPHVKWVWGFCTQRSLWEKDFAG